MTPDFHGFKAEEGMELSVKLLRRKMESMEESMIQLYEGMAKSESVQTELREEMVSLRKELRKANMMNVQLQEENAQLMKQLQNEAEEVRKCKEEVHNSVKIVKEQNTVWTEVQKENKESFKKIMESQRKDNEEIKNKVVSVIKEKEKLVRDTVDKVKTIVIFGVQEEDIVNKIERENKEKEKVREVMKVVVEDDEQTSNMMEEIHRIGKFEKGKDRPIKVKFTTQVKAEEVLNNTWRLAGKEKFKKVWINKDMDEEERKLLKELVEQTKQKNQDRTEEEKLRYYYQVRDLKIRKRVINK